MSQYLEVLKVATAVLAVGGVLLDLYSLALALRRNREGHGRSGVAGASWFAYLGFCMTRQQPLWLAGLTLFHASCHFIIPLIHKRLCAPSEEG